MRKPLLLEALDAIEIIHLPEREDRHRQLVRELRSIGLSIDDPQTGLSQRVDQLSGGRSVNHVFISTHIVPLHDQCVRLLKGHGCAILASANPRESVSIDGLIVARSPEILEPADIKISLRT